MAQDDRAGERPTQQDLGGRNTHRRMSTQLPPAEVRRGGMWKDPVDGRNMVYIPPGSFVFGAPSTAGRASWAAPLLPEHRVQLGGYWIDTTPVSNAAYRRFVERTGSPEPASWYSTLRGGDVMVSRDPVREWPKIAREPVAVTLNGAIAYCSWANKELPSEEQWEKAARGTDGRRYPWGSQWPEDLGTGSGKSQVGLAGLDVGPYGCLEMLISREWTRSHNSDGKRVLKGYPVPPGSTWGAAFEPSVAALWFRDLAAVGAEAAFRCVLPPGPRDGRHTSRGRPR
jgi:formylglycine-generating enzyme required for sulfatase activity